MGKSRSFERRLLVAVDIVGYGSRKGPEHSALQADLVTVLNEAAVVAGLSRDSWLKQAAGDGELAILPASEREEVVVDGYARQLDALLSARNRNVPAQRRIQLRMAVHFGPAKEADNGYAGQGIVTVSRLVDSPAIRAALTAAPEASVALILSRVVFDDVVGQGYVTFTATDFVRVPVRVKEYQEDAWLKVLGVDSSAWLSQDRDRAGSPPDDSAAVAAQAVTQHFRDVHAPGGVFGFSNSRGGDLWLRTRKRSHQKPASATRAPNG